MSSCTNPHMDYRRLAESFVVKLANREVPLAEVEGFNALVTAMEKLDRLFLAEKTAPKSSPKKATSDNFTLFASRISSAMGQQNHIQKQLASSFQITSFENKTIEDKSFGFSLSDSGATAEGPLIGIQVGKYFRSVKINKFHTYESTIQEVKNKDLGGKFHLLMKFSPEVEKTNASYLKFLLPVGGISVIAITLFGALGKTLDMQIVWASLVNVLSKR